jgi:L-ascorbate peroxidase
LLLLQIVITLIMLILGGYCWISRDSFLQAVTLLLLSASSENGLLADRRSPSQQGEYNPLSVSFPSTTTTNTAMDDFQPIQEQQRQHQVSSQGPKNEDNRYHRSSVWFRKEITQRVRDDPSLAGPLIRLAFHDAATFESGPTYVFGTWQQTGGSNGSIQWEQARPENRGIQRPLDVVKSILLRQVGEQQQQQQQPQTRVVFSLADAIALGGAAAVEAVGGPFIGIRMGRSDVTTADPELLRVPSHKATKRSLVTRTLPSPGLDSIGLRLYFGRLGLSDEEFVALSGCHGLGRHVSLLGMSRTCLKQLTRQCLEEAPVLLPFVMSSVDQWDPKSYFNALLRWNTNQIELGEVAFLPTDVALVVDDGLARHVQRFAKDPDYLNRVFARAYAKLVDHTATTVQRY